MCMVNKLSLAKPTIGLLIGLLFGVLFLAHSSFADILSGPFTTGSSARITLTRLILNRPTASQNDLLLASIAVNGGDQVLITPPTGWKQITRTDNEDDIALITYTKIVTSDEPDSYLWTIDGQTAAEGAIVTYKGMSISNPIDATSSNIGSSNSAASAPITTSSNDEQIVVTYATNVAKRNTIGNLFSTPKGMAEKFDVGNVPFGPSISLDESIQKSPGTFASVTSKIAGARPRNWASQVIALRKSAQIERDGYVGFVESPSGATSVSNSLTLSSRASVLVAFVYEDQGDTVTGVTANGVPMTKIGTGYMCYSDPKHTMSAWYLINPPKGPVVVTAMRGSSERVLEIASVGYANARITNIPDAYATKADTCNGAHASLSSEITTTTNNDWVVMASRSDNGSNATFSGLGEALLLVRGTGTDTRGMEILDTNGPVFPARTISLGMASSIPGNWLNFLVALAPQD